MARLKGCHSFIAPSTLRAIRSINGTAQKTFFDAKNSLFNWRNIIKIFLNAVSELLKRRDGFKHLQR